jgi:DNA mismatch repair protein MutL
MFPHSIELTPEKAAILKEIAIQIKEIGFEIEHFGQNTFIVKARPSTMEEGTDLQLFIDHIIDSYLSNIELKLGINENLARSFAVSSSVKRKKTLSQEEMQLLIDELFACENPQSSPSGKKCYITYSLEDLSRIFTS